MAIIDGYEIDAAEVEELELPSTVTKHPVERGANITDHIINDPKAINISGVVSDSPIGALADSRNEGAQHSADFFSRMETIRENREPVTVEIERGVFTNMVLTSFVTPTTPEDAIRFRARFEQVTLATTERAIVNVEVPRAQNKVNRNHKPSDEPKEFKFPQVLDTSQGESWLSRAWGF